MWAVGGRKVYYPSEAKHDKEMSKAELFRIFTTMFYILYKVI